MNVPTVPVNTNGVYYYSLDWENYTTYLDSLLQVYNIVKNNCDLEIVHKFLLLLLSNLNQIS